VTCKLGLAVGLDFFKLRVHVMPFLTFVRYQQTSIWKTLLPNRLFIAQQWLQRL